MSNNLTLVDNIPVLEDYFTNLKDQRAYYIMDRVVLLQFAFLIITGTITSFIIMADIQNSIIEYWFSYLIVIPGIIISLSLLKRKMMGPSKTWKEAILPIMLLWFALTISLGSIFDVMFGIGTTFWVSTFMAIYYGLGYILAKKIRRNRFRVPKKYWQISVPIMCITFCLVPLISGLNILNEIVAKYNIRSFFLHDYGEFLNCFPCALSIFYLISGIGITLSMLLNYCVLADLCLDTVKSNVIYKPPSKLIFNYLMGTSIIMFVLWVFFEILIPPLIGGRGSGSISGGGGSGGAGGGTSKRMLDASFVPDLNRVNQIWDNYIIPATYIPFIISLIGQEQLKLKKKLDSPKNDYKRYYVQHTSDYTTDYSYKRKRYSRNYSPYAFNKLYKVEAKLNQPMEQFNKYKDNLARKYGLKKI
jgi:hypothetical protein